MSSSFKMSSDEAKDSLRSSFKMSSDEVKDSLRSSFYLSSEEVREVCDPCKTEEGIEKTALFFCQECKEFLCGDCREFHRKVSMTKNHSVLRTDGPNTDAGQKGKVTELSKHLSNITVSGATKETHAGPTAGALKPFRKATLTNQINVSLDDDEKPCEIRGILIVDNLIYVADRNNGKIKLFDLAGHSIAQYSGPSVYDITAIGKDRIAFTSLKQYFTILSKTGNTLKHIKTVDTSVPTKGICCYNGLIYVSLHGSNESSPKSQIIIFTTKGEVKQRIEPRLEGRKVLMQPGYLCLSQHTGIMYVVDFVSGVIALSSNGNVQFITQVFSQTKTAQGIDIDDHGQVYICGAATDNVMTMSADGNDVYEILNKECARAQAVRIVGNKMYLSCRNTDFVCVLKLS